MNEQNVIAIDGPSGSGKSAITRTLAEKFGFLHINSGALFRSISVYLMERNLLDEFFRKSSLEQFEELKSLELSYHSNKKLEVSINGESLTSRLQNHEVSDITSRLSKLKAVREIVDLWQKEILEVSQKICIVEGRDIGTAIFPQAKLKIFLTATPEERARRRYGQLQRRGLLGDLTLETLIEDIQKRDDRDMNREIAPLKKAADAIEIDSTDFSEEKTIEELSAIIKERFKV